VAAAVVEEEVAAVVAMASALGPDLAPVSASLRAESRAAV
jgi:hypothetical protein